MRKTTGNMTRYNADNIKILHDPLVFDYELAVYLARKYHRPLEFITRSIEACRLAGVDPREYFVPRYLDGDKDIPVNEDVAAISRELQRNLNQKRTL